jgi:hypothetical protein
VTTTGECPDRCLTELRDDIGRLGQVLSATVGQVYRTGGWWRVPVSIDSTHARMCWSPRFRAFDDATVFRLGVLEMLEQAT